MEMMLNNPMISQMVEANPQMKAILSNPEMLKMALSPESMAMAQAMMQGGQMNPSPMYPQQPSQPMPTTDFKAIYSAQLAQMADMGFTDADKNIAALKKTQGNVSAAIEVILSSI